MTLKELKAKTLAGDNISREEALWLASFPEKEELYAAANEIREKMCGKHFDTCSIINARSGRCSENCKWCAQSVVFKTDVETYDLIDESTCIEMAKSNAQYGIDKFSFVTSGRALSDKNVDKLCEYAVRIKQEVPIKLCASMGLLKKEQLAKLMKVGITRYHCNLESSEKHFPTLCSTHSIQDKIDTLKAAREVGMEICSGGIIGMGESMDDRIDLALKLREIGVKSVPMNILNPIPGTPLEGMPPLSDEEILTTIAVYRFLLPDAYLRFAGGRILIEHLEEKAMQVSINSAIIGDMLTTPGAKIEQDFKLIKQLGYSY